MTAGISCYDNCQLMPLLMTDMVSGAWASGGLLNKINNTFALIGL